MLTVHFMLFNLNIYLLTYFKMYWCTGVTVFILMVYYQHMFPIPYNGVADLQLKSLVLVCVVGGQSSDTLHHSHSVMLEAAIKCHNIVSTTSFSISVTYTHTCLPSITATMRDNSVACDCSVQSLLSLPLSLLPTCGAERNNLINSQLMLYLMLYCFHFSSVTGVDD